jgi:hypothetical protein
LDATRPYRPGANAKVVRWFQTVLRECLYLRPLESEVKRHLARNAYVEYQTHDRPNVGINGLTALSSLASRSTTL